MKIFQVKENFKNFCSTKFALIWMNIFNEPFVALYSLILFILRKDLNASAFQISIFVTIRPVIALFSFYWSSNLSKRKNKLVSNLMGAWVLARLPFVLLPFFPNVWYLIFACSIYQLFYRAQIPALMEILKQNMQKEKREKLFSLVYVLSFAESIFLGLFVGKFLDIYPSSWKFLFLFFAFISMTSIFFQRKIKIKVDEKVDENISLKKRIVQPWRDFLEIMKKRPDFARFQMGFMFGGIGLMLIAPALAIYYVDVLSLSHEQITIARYIWMGLGVSLSTFIWKNKISKLPIKKVTMYILFGFGLFPLILLLAKFNLTFLNLAFLVYGIAQAGSHLLWNLSGTIFAGDEDSSKYTGINILMVGIRGAVAPVVGGLLCVFINPMFVLVLGSAFCISGILYISYASRRVIADNF